MTSTDTTTGHAAAAEQHRLAIVPEGATIAWLAPMPSSDNPDAFLHLGVVGRALGESRLGNMGRAVEGCPCGFSHNVSRYTPVTVVSAAGGVPPATVGYYDAEAEERCSHGYVAEDGHHFVTASHGGGEHYMTTARWEACDDASAR